MVRGSAWEAASWTSAAAPRVKRCGNERVPKGARADRFGDARAAGGAVAAFEPHVLDVGAGGLGHAQPVEGEQGDQGVPGRRAEPGGDQERADLVAVQPVARDSLTWRRSQSNAATRRTPSSPNRPASALITANTCGQWVPGPRTVPADSVW